MNTITREIPASLLTGALGLIALVLVSTTGCKMMTENQRLAYETDREDQARADSAIEENLEAVAELDAEEQQLKLKVEASAGRVQRSRDWQAAADLLAKGEPEGALAAVTALLEEDARSAAVYEAARAEGNTDEFITETVPVESGDPAVPPVEKERLVLPPMDDGERARMLVVRGTAEYDLGNTDRAVADYERAVDLDPSFRPARINFGKMLFADGKFRAALKAWKHELDDGYRSADLLFYIGQSLYELGHMEKDPNHFEAARAAIREAFVARPDDTEIRRWLGLIEFETQRYESAIRYFEGILAKNPLDTYYMEMIANCAIELGDYRRAADQLETVARLDGSPKPALCLSLSDIYAQLGIHDRAALWMQRAYGGVESMPTEDRLQLGFLLFDAERLGESLQVFLGIPEDAPEYGDAQSQAAQIELRLGRTADAAARMTGLFEKRPTDGALRLVAGDVLLEQKDYDQALAAYSSASGLPGTRAAGFVGVAETYYATGNLRKSIEYYEKAVEAAPERASYRHALDEIKAEQQLNRSADDTAATT